MDDKVLIQKKLFEETYDLQHAARFDFHVTANPLIRYLRDRRLLVGLRSLQATFSSEELLSWRVLIVCGGVGGEGIFFRHAGFQDVTVSDFSPNSLLVANRLDSSLKTIELNAEDIDLPDQSYDLVVVQDGLHHLPRPSLGFTEMLRVARKAIMVIEPYDSLVGNVIGTEWETHGETINFVFRWNRTMVEQTVKSYLLRDFRTINVFRLWDHNLVIGRIAKRAPQAFQLRLAKLLYGLLTMINFTGNMMVAIVLK